MDNRTEVRDFLPSRRARLPPQQAGLALYSSNRRVAGLRREEVALLADVITDYYTRLERGNLRGVSESVLEALANALQLDESESAHLLDLARAANTSNRQRRTPPNHHLRPGVQRILDSIGAPAYVRNNRLDLLGVNRLRCVPLRLVASRSRIWSRILTPPPRSLDGPHLGSRARSHFMTDGTRIPRIRSVWSMSVDPGLQP